MPISRNKLKRIRDIIKRYERTMLRIFTGGGSISNEDMDKLGIPEDFRDVAKFFYSYGKLSKLRDPKVLERLSLEQIKDLVQSMTFSPSHLASIEFARINTGTYISGLYSKIGTDVVSTLNRNDNWMLQGVKDIVADGLANNERRAEVATQLREFTSDWDRDWNRVAHTEMWNAKLQGEVMTILSKESPLSKQGAETLVFKRPAPDACPHCIRLYLEKDGVTPRVFKLSDMLGYGTNHGRKTADWKPVVGTMHPNCRCTLNIMPPGLKFDKRGQMVSEGV